MIKYHKCSLCGTITDNFNDAVNHAISHAHFPAPYAESKGLYVCPVCNTCSATEEDMKMCINKHLEVLERLDYIYPYLRGQTLQ